VFGHKWVGSIPVTRTIALYTLFATLAIPPGTVLKVTRRAKLMVIFSVPMVFMLAALLLIFTSQGIVAVAIATTALQATVAPVQATVVSRQLAIPLWASIRELIPPTLAAGTMAAVLVGIAAVISTSLPLLLVGIPVGGAVYLGVLWLVARDKLLVLRDMALPRSAAPL